PPNPLNVYGQSKLAGEKGIQVIGGQFYIFRTSWVYSNKRKNFYLSVKKKIEDNKEFSVVSDQFGVPTSSLFIAQKLHRIINKLNPDNKGIYHLVPNGSCSWFDFAKLIAKKINPNFNLNKLIPISTFDYSSKIVRPRNSVLNNQEVQSTFMIEFESWEFELDQIINGT
ncbi:MAG: NAD(P)-dependent oxidoreductase, partial [Porticoccus sp.]|nr:NAD(P)-dependent oxidoreductase [Porticoccus sp.]